MNSDLGEWLRSSQEHGSGRVTGADLLLHWRGLANPITQPEARALAAAMDAAGFCFEPDIRFSGHVVRPVDTVITYPSNEPAGAPSASYLAAAGAARLGVIVASADNLVLDQERVALRERASKAIYLTSGETRRLDAYTEWLLDTPIALDGLESEIGALSAGDRLRIGRFLVVIAGADGSISPAERWVLSGTFALLGLTSDQLETEINTFIATRDAIRADEVGPAVVQNAAVIAAVAGLLPIGTSTPHSAIEASAPYERPADMSEWEATFARAWASLSAADRRRAGSLLSLVPKRGEWADLVASWKALPLVYWLAHEDDYPHALAVLFGGFAFFEYDETSFWPQFQRDLWPMTEAQRNALRTAHAVALERLGLEMTRNQSDDRMTVASAVHHIGVPLSLWADFLGIADFVLRQEVWTTWTSERWQAEVGPRCGGLTRLRDFLIANETAARVTIAELGEIRDYANAEPTSTIEELAGVSNVALLRDEYFDDVPETAEFFRPDNLLSLFAGRCFLRYDDEGSRLQVHLPAVPAPGGFTWRVGNKQKPALREPSWFTIDADAFAPWIDVHLDGPSGRRTRRVPGIRGWGLYDQRREAFLDLDLRRPGELRMGDYLLVASRPLNHMTRRGFLSDFPENQIENLADGTSCWVTRLSPAAREGSLRVRWAHGMELIDYTISFRSRLSLRPRTMIINGVERQLGDPSLPWYFLRPGPYPPIDYASLPRMELTTMSNQGSASAYARLKQYTEQGVIAARADGAWRLDRERAQVARTGDTVQVSFLGLPTHLWALGKGEVPLSLEIAAVGGLTYLRAVWPASHETSIRQTLRQYGIAVDA